MGPRYEIVDPDSSTFCARIPYQQIPLQRRRGVELRGRSKIPAGRNTSDDLVSSTHHISFLFSPYPENNPARPSPFLVCLHCTSGACLFPRDPHPEKAPVNNQRPGRQDHRDTHPFRERDQLSLLSGPTYQLSLPSIHPLQKTSASEPRGEKATATASFTCDLNFFSFAREKKKLKSNLRLLEIFIPFDIAKSSS